MEHRFCGWRGTSEWEISFEQAFDSKEEAEAFAKRARSAAGNLKGRPRNKVSVQGRTVFLTLKYSRGTIEREMKVTETQAIASKVISELHRKLR